MYNSRKFEKVIDSVIALKDPETLNDLFEDDLAIASEYDQVAPTCDMVPGNGDSPEDPEEQTSPTIPADDDLIAATDAEVQDPHVDVMERDKELPEGHDPEDGNIEIATDDVEAGKGKDVENLPPNTPHTESPQEEGEFKISEQQEEVENTPGNFPHVKPMSEEEEPEIPIEDMTDDVEDGITVDPDDNASEAECGPDHDKEASPHYEEEVRGPHGETEITDAPTHETLKDPNEMNELFKEDLASLARRSSTLRVQGAKDQWNLLDRANWDDYSFFTRWMENVSDQYFYRKDNITRLTLKGPHIIEFSLDASNKMDRVYGWWDPSSKSMELGGKTYPLFEGIEEGSRNQNEVKKDLEKVITSSETVGWIEQVFNSELEGTPNIPLKIKSIKVTDWYEATEEIDVFNDYDDPRYMEGGEFANVGDETFWATYYYWIPTVQIELEPAEGKESPSKNPDVAPMGKGIAQILNGSIVVMTGSPPGKNKKKDVEKIIKDLYGVKGVDPRFTKKTEVVIYDGKSKRITEKLKSAIKVGLKVVDYWDIPELVRE